MVKENRYFDYLCCLVGRSQEYSILLDELHSIEFYSLIPNDDNRGSDGEYLRSLFIDEVGHTWSTSLPDGPCTVLEMLIGLAYRLEFETSQSQWEKSPHEWFWILIDNLGLLGCTNEEYVRSHCTADRIHDICDMLLSRQYTYSGEGGLFPLKYAQKDQRRVEIWYQMSAYVMENYPM